MVMLWRMGGVELKKTQGTFLVSSMLLLPNPRHIKINIPTIKFYAHVGDQNQFHFTPTTCN
jgi:hypothetical protein